jgi:hypothetical protein
MTTHPNFGHVPTTAAASKALAAGGASRKGRPSPFHRALESPELSYHHWWILTALRVRTAATALKLQEEEKAKLRAGFKTNGYGDLTSHTYGHITQDRRVQPYGFTVTKLHGFNKWKKRYSPIKSTHYVTSHLFDALHAVLKITVQIQTQDTQQKAAAKAGFTSVKAYERHRIHVEALLSGERAAGYNAGVQAERQRADSSSLLYADLNDYGIAPGRDRVEGNVLVLVNFSRTREHRVSLVEYLNLPATSPAFKNVWRENGWRLPAFTPPAPLPSPKTVKFHLQAHERRIDDSAGIQHTA